MENGWRDLEESHGTFNTLRPKQNGRHLPDDIFQWIFLNENELISINNFIEVCS